MREENNEAAALLSYSNSVLTDLIQSLLSSGKATGLRSNRRRRKIKATQKLIIYSFIGRLSLREDGGLSGGGTSPFKILE